MVVLATALILIAGVLYLLLREEMRYRRLADMERERSAMLGIISHRLRTPITTVKWYTELLRESGVLTDEQKDYLNKLEGGVENAHELLERFLRVSRAENGGILIRPDMVDVQEMVKMMIEAFSENMKEKQQLLNFEEKGTRLSAYVDPIVMQAVMDALLSNAISYTPIRGKIFIEVSDEKNHVVLTVMDTGIGIPKKEQKKIFSKFFRATNASLGTNQGSGINLFIAKLVLEAHKGKISFESEEDVGTTFTVSLPLV